MVAVSVVVLAVAVILFTVWLLKTEARRRKYAKLGGPPSLPLIGNVHQLKRSTEDFTKQLLEYSESYGSLGAFHLMLGTYCLPLVTRAEHAEPFLSSTKHMSKSVDYEFLHPWLGTGLLTSTGAKWKTRRRMLTPTFHFRILNDFVRVFNEQSQTLLGVLRKKAGKQEFDIFKDITNCALDIICETAMGKTVNAQSDTNSDYVWAVNRLTELILIRQRTPWYWPDFLYNTIGNGKESEKCLKILHGFTEKVIHEKQAEFNKHHSSTTTMEEFLEERSEEAVGQKKKLAFMDMLLCTTSDGEKLSFYDIREEVDTFMFEGHDTTAAAMSYVTYFIGFYPEVQKKVHEELDRIFGDSDRPATMEDLKEMKYLECCIKEALRVCPSVPFFARSLSEDTKVRDVELKKGDTIVIVAGAIHRDPRYFPDPEHFDPDRFLPENIAKRHPYCYIPFSAGMRNCIGQKFALLEEKTVASTIFRNFNVTSLDAPEDLVVLAELILRPEAIRVKLTPRR